MEKTPPGYSPAQAPPYPPPPGGGPVPAPMAVTYSPGAPQGGVTVIQPVREPFFGQDPVEMTCKFCYAHITTGIEYENGALVWLIFGILFILGWFLFLPWCFCWIPFCIDSCKDVVHRCPNCHRVLGCYKVLFGRSEPHQ